MTGIARVGPMSEPLHFDTPLAYANALDTLLAGAKREICIYDWDLSDGGYANPERIQLLTDFCKRDRYRRLRVLLADDFWLKNYAGQLMQLLKVWGHILQVRLRETEPPPLRDTFVLVDEYGALKRFDNDAYRGVMYPHSRGDVVSLGIRFESEWERAPGIVATTTLGL